MTFRELYTRLIPVTEIRTSASNHGAEAQKDAANEAKAIVRMVLELGFDMSYTDIVCGKVSELSAEDQQSLEEIMLRLEKGEPVQYVLGKAEFDGRIFHVEPGVLIPRPETAELVEAIPSPFKDEETHNPVKVLDIGTGSGCIAISIALDYPDTEVSAWDISDKAVAIAKTNAKRLGAKVSFGLHDILEEAKNAESSLSLREKKADLIVSNPPYIAEKEAKDMARNVLDFEPETALFVPDNDPLKFYRAIADFGRYALEDNGWLYLEINPLYAGKLHDMLAERKYQHIGFWQDMFGKTRFCKAQLTKTK